jgi:hypothetical protein
MIIMYEPCTSTQAVVADTCCVSNQKDPGIIETAKENTCTMGEIVGMAMQLRDVLRGAPCEKNQVGTPDPPPACLIDELRLQSAALKKAGDLLKQSLDILQR